MLLSIRKIGNARGVIISAAIPIKILVTFYTQQLIYYRQGVCLFHSQD